jgi:hypothetical protein
MPPKSSRFRGVTLFKPTGKWRAQISAGAARPRLQQRARAGSGGVAALSARGAAAALSTRALRRSA